MTSTEKFDVIVCGQGIAGTTLAWTLLRAGAKVLVIDRDALQTASRIAAGLITPVSGRRFTVAPQFEQLLSMADEHYRHVSNVTGTRCLQLHPALRFTLTPTEQSMLATRRDALGKFAVAIEPAPATGLPAAQHGFAMPHARRLNVGDYLDQSRAYFKRNKHFVKAVLDADSVSVGDDTVSIRLGASIRQISARHLVFCGGFADATNPWLPAGAFNAAKGEILTVRIPGFTEQRTIHAADIWLAASGQAEIYRCGATYDHDDLTTTVTATARRQLTSRLQRFLDRPFAVLDQHAAIRPIGMHRMPIIGCHATHSQVAWFNGLGSKGALWAPALARVLADHLLHGAPIDTDAVRPPGALAAPRISNRH